MKNINPTRNVSHTENCALSRRLCRFSKYQAAFFALCLGVLCAVPLGAQTVRFRSSLVGVTVPLNLNGTVVITNQVSLSGTGGAYVDLSVSGLPTGATVTSITDTNGNPLPVDSGLPATTISTNILVTLTLNNVAEGLYTLNLNGAGAAVNNWSFYLQVGYLWSGTDFFFSGPNTNWTDTGNWVGGVVPPDGSDVVFGQLGATNAVNTNIIVNQNESIGSLRFAPTNSTQKFYTMLIQDGVTLAMTNNNGFSMLKDYLNLYSGLGGLTVTIAGGNGTMAVSNENANVTVYADNSQASTLDMSGLGSFISDVSRVGLGDYTLLPFYRNFNDQNGYSGRPNSPLVTVNLARTNVIRSLYVDPNNYTNADSRSYSFSWMKGSELSGSSTVPNFNLGISNIFYVDSALFIGANSRGNLQFNSIFAASNPVCVFRGTNGGRMSVFTVSDGAATNTANSNIKATIDFSRGTLDMLVDRFYVARDRKLIVSGGTPSYQGGFVMGNGIVDANSAVIGFREYNQTNTTPASGGFGSTEGSIIVQSNGVFKVNTTLTLGSSVNTNSAARQYAANNLEYGQATIANGGTLIANTILVGGPVYGASRNNFIVISNSATMIISNTVAGTNQYLDLFSLNNGSTNQMAIDGSFSGAYIFATNVNFNTTTTHNVIRIASVNNLSSFPVQLPLISHVAGTIGSLPDVVMPSGYTGTLTDNGPGSTIDLIISTRTPSHLLWRGTTANWDLTSPNWLDQDTGLTTNFNNFDVVAFDNAGGYPTTISVTANVITTAINMTNSSLNYTFNASGGQISGSATFTKSGAGQLDVELATTAAYVINQGSMIVGGGGSASGVTLAANTVLTSSGTINSGVNCAGTATINSGNVNGSLTVLNGGVVTNQSNIRHGTITLQPGSFLYNGGSGTLDDFASSTVSSNATLINDGGYIGSPTGGYIQTLAVSGTLKDIGTGGYPSMSLQTLTINPGGSFMPGGDAIGSTEIRPPLGASANNPGRVILSIGSTNVVYIDPGANNNTTLLSGYQDFGPSQSGQLQNGCTIVINKVGASSYSNGQYFRLFQDWNGANSGNPIPSGTATNSFPIIIPSNPGPGLVWDLSHLWNPMNDGTWGYIGVIVPPVVHLTNTFTIVGGSNIIGQFSWNAAYFGYRLQSQANPLSIGLSNNWSNASDGSTNGPSWNKTSISITNTLGTNAVFYRLAYP